MKYIPDRWVIIKIPQADGTVWKKVAASWYGGYVGTDWWKISSNIEWIDESQEDRYIFHNLSGSEYHCKKSLYGMGVLLANVLHQYGQYQTIEIDEDFGQ